MAVGCVRGGWQGDEPVMRVERVRSVRSSAAVVAEGPFECRLCRLAPFELVGMHEP